MRLIHPDHKKIPTNYRTMVYIFMTAPNDFQIILAIENKRKTLDRSGHKSHWTHPAIKWGLIFTF